MNRDTLRRLLFEALASVAPEAQPDRDMPKADHASIVRRYPTPRTV